MDCDRKLFFAAEGQSQGSVLFPTCRTVGPHMCLCIYSKWARISGRRPGEGDGILPNSPSSRCTALQRMVSTSRSRIHGEHVYLRSGAKVWVGNLLSPAEQTATSGVPLPSSDGTTPHKCGTVRLFGHGMFTSPFGSDPC